jgi:hypothetical protein
LHQAYKRLGIDLPIHHIHVLQDLDEIEANLKQERKAPADTLAHVELCRRLRQEIEAHPDWSWKIISPVREPVARNVGTFFHNLGEFVPDWRERHAAGKLSQAFLRRTFLEIESIHQAPELWFDAQLKPVFGIDVYASPFPHDSGYKTYWSKPRTPLLVIRLEDMDRVAAEAMHEFLALDGFEIVRSNVGEEKDYADLYRKFKALPLPRAYVEKMYASRYARHFYTPEELQRFFQQWTGGSAR